ncbi:MAG TPA: hypothetical protein VGO98_01965 [Candidatus Saccharimonadales bacterium]|jgi:hypothetical protein|nr:hypothetical protein [Candidatus Saccharimonadales bacterium]
MTAGHLLVQEAIRPDTDVDLHLAADLIPQIVKNLRRGLKIILSPASGRTSQLQFRYCYSLIVIIFSA